LKNNQENPGDACGNGAGGGERGIKRGAEVTSSRKVLKTVAAQYPSVLKREGLRDGEIASAGESEWISEGRAGAGREPIFQTVR